MFRFARAQGLRALAVIILAVAGFGALRFAQPAPAGADSPSMPPGAVPAAHAPVPSAEPPKAPRTVGEPLRVLIPGIAVNARLHPVGLLPSGAMETPDFGEAGWYDRGPAPGAAGPSVIVAHVHGPAGDDVFARLRELRPGDQVTVIRADGTATFAVTRIEQVAKEALPTKRIWNQTDRAVLRLITCAGEPDPVTRVYPDNTVVYARWIR